MAIASIIGTDNKVPGVYLKVSLGVGARSAGSAAMGLLLVGNKTAGGSAAVDTVKSLFSKDDARNEFGAGSELFMMAQAAFKANPSVTLSGVAVTESVGSQATGTITFTAGPATADGTVEVWIGGRRVVAAVADTDTITTAAAAVAAAINAETDFPVTAGAAVGVVTVTAKQAGTKSNAITLRTLLTGATGIAHTALSTTLTGGTTLDDPQSALDSVAATRYHLIAASDDDAVNLAKYKAHVDAGAEPLVGLRQRFVAGSVDTLGNTTTLSDALNAERGQIVWQAGSDDTPAEIAAASAAQHIVQVQSDRAAPVDGVVIPGLRPPNDSADKPLNTELASALNNGITPLDYSGSEVFFVRAITNYSTDSAGNPDAGVLDVSKVEVPDFIADQLQANFLARFGGFKLDNDPDQGDFVEPKVATPSSVKDFIFEILKNHGAGGSGVLLLSDVEANKPLLATELDSAAVGRVNAVVPLDVVEGFHQGAFDIQQVG